jgi:hypothetical protein
MYTVCLTHSLCVHVPHALCQYDARDSGCIAFCELTRILLTVCFPFFLAAASTFTHIQMYVCMRVYIHMYAYKYTHKRARREATHIQNVHIHAKFHSTRILVYICTHVCTHTYIYTYIHTEMVGRAELVAGKRVNVRSLASSAFGGSGSSMATATNAATSSATSAPGNPPANMQSGEWESGRHADDEVCAELFRLRLRQSVCACDLHAIVCVCVFDIWRSACLCLACCVLLY